MARRIIGQCNTTDFKDIEHLATLVSLGEHIYPGNMTGRQKAAVLVVHHFQSCGVPFEVLFKIREVLVWEMPDKGLAFEYKLLNPYDAGTLLTLQTMAPRQVKIPALMRAFGSHRK